MTITGEVYEMQTDPLNPTEILDGSTVQVVVHNSLRGSSLGSLSLYDSATGGYSIDVHTDGSDCLLEFWVDPPDPGDFTSIQVMVKADLSGTTPVVDVTEDPLSMQSVDVTGESTMTGFEMALDSPYGQLPQTDILPIPAIPFTISFPNPFGYDAVWSQWAGDGTTYPNWVKLWASIAAPQSVVTSITLPAVDYSVGPASAPNETSISLSGNVLSMAAVTDTDLYLFSLQDPSGLLPQYGAIISSGPSVHLAAWMTALLAGKTVRVAISPMASSGSLGPDYLMTSSTEAISPVSMGQMINTNGYKDIDF